jgi:hypothetical protein
MLRVIQMLTMIRTVLAVSVLLSAAAANATDVSGAQTVWVLGYPVTTGGNAVGCAIEFSGVGKDYANKQGNLIALTGSLQIRRNNKYGLFGLVKIIIDDFEGEARNPARPASIHLVTSDGTIVRGNPTLAQPSDSPGGLLQTFNLDDNFVKIFTEIIVEKTLIVAFNRTQGGTDLRFPLDLTVKAVDPKKGKIERSDQMVQTFQLCTNSLLKD